MRVFLCTGSRIAEETYSEAEQCYVQQGQQALQKSISILTDQDGWQTEIESVFVINNHTNETLQMPCICAYCIIQFYIAI